MERMRLSRKRWEEDPDGRQPFCDQAALRIGRGVHPASSPRLAGPQNDPQFFIPLFFNSLLRGAVLPEPGQILLAILIFSK